MLPTIGRIVHFVLPKGSPNQGKHIPAIVTEVHGEALVITVFKSQRNDIPLGLANMGAGTGEPVASISDVKHDEAAGLGTWHWPEKETASDVTPPAAPPTAEPAAAPVA